MTNVSKKRILLGARKRIYYLYQRGTRSGIDEKFERDLKWNSIEYMKGNLYDYRTYNDIPKINLAELNVEDQKRYSIFRKDIYKRFVEIRDGVETDYFGRKGKWIPRGCKIYFDERNREYIKLFDEYFCRRGEGRFLHSALEAGLYDFLCRMLSYVIVDDTSVIRGYAISEGRQTTPYEFQRYVGGSLRELICNVTERTGLYFYDMTFHNAILGHGMLSFIDLESVLPIEWFGKGDEFSIDHLSEIDVGWAIQKKWRSPRWYRRFVRQLAAQRYVTTR